MTKINDQIAFADIKALFPKDTWDVGYMSETQLKICAYSPLKEKLHSIGLDFSNSVHFHGWRNCIVLIKETPHAGDYGFYDTAQGILSESQFKWCMIYTNLKEAALQAGLGVKAKNSLLYSYRFGFDCKICVVGFNETITDVPTNRRVNKKLWNRCVGCWDCAINCPVKAIHNDGDKMENNWLDSAACDAFLGLGDHPRIPSVKKFWHKNLYPELSKKEVAQLKTFDQVKEKYGEPFGLPFDRNGYTSDPALGVKKEINLFLFLSVENVLLSQDVVNGMESIRMKKCKKFLKGLTIAWLCVMWLIMLPFLWLYDRIFGGWK